MVKIAERQFILGADFQDVKHLFFERVSRDKNGMVIESLSDIAALAKAWVSSTALNVPSDAAVNGVAIITYALPANTFLVLTKIKVGSDGEQTISIAFGTALNALTDMDHFYLNTKQMWAEFSDLAPVLVILPQAAAVNVYVYAKTGTIMGVTNNPALGARHYMGTIAGFTL